MRLLQLPAAPTATGAFSQQLAGESPSPVAYELKLIMLADGRICYLPAKVIHSWDDFFGLERRQPRQHSYQQSPPPKADFDNNYGSASRPIVQQPARKPMPSYDSTTFAGSHSSATSSNHSDDPPWCISKPQPRDGKRSFSHGRLGEPHIIDRAKPSPPPREIIDPPLPYQDYTPPNAMPQYAARPSDDHRAELRRQIEENRRRREEEAREEREAEMREIRRLEEYNARVRAEEEEERQRARNRARAAERRSQQAANRRSENNNYNAAVAERSPPNATVNHDSRSSTPEEPRLEWWEKQPNVAQRTSTNSAVIPTHRNGGGGGGRQPNHTTDDEPRCCAVAGMCNPKNLQQSVGKQTCGAAQSGGERVRRTTGRGTRLKKTRGCFATNSPARYAAAILTPVVCRKATSLSSR